MHMSFCEIDVSKFKVMTIKSALNSVLGKLTGATYAKEDPGLLWGGGGVIPILAIKL